MRFEKTVFNRVWKVRNVTKGREIIFFVIKTFSRFLNIYAKISCSITSIGFETMQYTIH